MSASSHADTLIIIPVSVERRALPQGEAEVSFLTLAASTDANEPRRQTDGRTDSQLDRQAGRPEVSCAKGGSSQSPAVFLVDFHDL